MRRNSHSQNKHKFCLYNCSENPNKQIVLENKQMGGIFRKNKTQKVEH